MRLPVFAFVASSLLLITACSESLLGTGATTQDITSEVALKGEAKMFPGFAYDTGLQPASGPAQVSLALKTEGALRVEAAGARGGDSKLEGKPGSGKLAIDLHAKLAGRLKVDTTLKKYDGAIPGLDNIDVAAVAEAAFNPFLLEEGQEVETVADVPETKLPPIPLGSVPGSLELTVKSGSVVRAKLHGTCLRGASGAATFQGETTTSGKLVLKAVVKLDLPKPLDKEVELPEIVVNLPETKGTLDAVSDASGIADFEAGVCGGASGETGAKSAKSGGGKSSGSSSSSTSSSSGGGTSSSSSSSSSGGSTSSSGGSSGTVDIGSVSVAIEGSAQPMNSGSAFINEGSLLISLKEHGSAWDAPHVFLSIERTGNGCGKFSSTTGMHQSLAWIPTNGLRYDSKEDASCGLTISRADFAVGGRVAGSFDGDVTIPSYETPPTGVKRIVHVSATFNVPVNAP